MSDASSSALRPWSVWRILRWFVFLLVCGAVFGPPYLEAFRPQNKVSDFLQDWLSARSYRNGGPVYVPQRELVREQIDVSAEVAARMLPWNAHPPASVLLVLPFGGLSYADAHFAWNLANLPLFVISLLLLIRELRIRFCAASILPTLALSLAAFPLYSQLQQAQSNILLLFLIVLGWWFDRRGYFWLAGVAIGVAAAIKLFPAFLFLYFLAQRRWSALLTGAVAFVLLNALALALFGIDDIKTYLNEVVPSVANYQSSRQNGSLAGFWLRIFDPHPNENIVGLVQLPMLGKLLTYGTRLFVTLAVFAFVWRARSRGELDRSFALAIVGMLLVSPIAWPHYFLMLALPFAFVWNFARGLGWRILFWLAFVLMMLPNYYFPSIVMGQERGTIRYLRGETEVSAIHNLTLASLPNYALASLFVLTMCVRPPENAKS